MSNFTEAQVQHLIDAADIQPAVNQIEVHPYCAQRPLRAFHAARGVVTMGYSPLGSSAARHPPGHDAVLLAHPVVREVAAAAGRTPAQVLVRWALQSDANLVTIPKSSNAARIAQNIDVTAWALSDAAMAQLDGLNSDFRYFISYLKKPDNQRLWHDGVVETGTDADWVR